MENSLIRTSLKSIKGSQQDEAVQLLNMFALVPEDTLCPLDVMGMLFASAGEGFGVGNDEGHPIKPKLKRIPPRLLLRKWLKILIDRSLVLGTVDRPVEIPSLSNRQSAREH